MLQLYTYIYGNTVFIYCMWFIGTHIQALTFYQDCCIQCFEKLGLAALHSTNDLLLFDETLWTVKLVGLSPPCELTLGREETCALSTNPVKLPRTFKSTLHYGNTFCLLLLQVNVTSSLSDTTYTPGISIGTASPNTSRVTDKGKQAFKFIMAIQIVKHTLKMCYKLKN